MLSVIRIQHGVSCTGVIRGAVLLIPAILALAGVLCITNSPARASESSERYPLVVSGGAQSMTVPWHTGPMTKRYNPVFIVGAENTLKSWGSWRLYQTANLGYFQHYWWISGVFVDSELGIGRGLPFGFSAELRLGAGYLHYFWRRKVLELEDGEYVEATNWGKPSVMVPFSAVLGYRDIPAGPMTVTPFISAQWAVQMLLIDESDVMTHVFLLIGARVNWN